jgi:hypothetical protein
LAHNDLAEGKVGGQIYLLKGKDEIIAMSEEPYDTEAVLQSILAEHPELLAGDQINPDNPRQWILISREVGIPGDEDEGGRWSLDHLFIDQDAIPTLVEVKRSSDTRIRREVVGQMLDYASNAVVYWNVDEIRLLYEETCKSKSRDPQVFLHESLNKDLSYDDFWNQVKTNLQNGKVRLLFVADEIPDELQTVVEFLNGQMERAEVLAVSIKQYLGETQRTLVPRVIGQTSAARGMKEPRRRKKWDEESFFQDLKAKSTAEDIDVARSIYDWSKSKHLRIWWGEGSVDGSFVPVFDYKGTKNQLFVVWTTGQFEFYFYWYAYKKPFDKEEARLDLLGRINECLDEKLPADVIGRRPTIALHALRNKDALMRLLSVFDWFIDQVKANN